MKAAVMMALTFIVACTEDSGVVDPPELRGTIEVTTTTTGRALDPDGYALALNGGAIQLLGANDTRVLSDLAATGHDVELTGIAANCTLAGSNRRTIQISAGETVAISFVLSCAAGSLEVLTSTHGREPDTDGYLVYHNVGSFPIGSTDAVSVDEMPAQAVLLELAGLAPTCAVIGENPRIVPVPANDAISTTFDVVCQASLAGQIVYWSTVANASGEFDDFGIYVMNSDGSDQFRLTPEGMQALQPAVSPDGSRIVFVRDDQIHVMAPNGSGAIQLSPGLRTSSSPVWSPDGAKIAFGGWDSTTGITDILIMNSDGTGLVNLTNSADSGNRWPTWSPDGTQIAFASSRDRHEPNLGTDIFVMNSDGTAVVNLTGAEESGVSAPEPAWSPDGSKIAFTSSGDSGSDVWLMNRDGSNKVNLTESGVSYGPSWAPNGSRILFTSYSLTNSDVYSMNTDGSDPVNLTNRSESLEFISSQAWSP